MERPTLNVGSTIPCAGVQNRIKKKNRSRKETKQPHSFPSAFWVRMKDGQLIKHLSPWFIHLDGLCPTELEEKKPITCVLVRVSTGVKISRDRGVYIGRKVSPKSRLKLCTENINTYSLEDSAWEHILSAFNSDSFVFPGHWQHAAIFSLKNPKNKPLYRCRFLDIFASFKAPWTERLLSTSLSVLLTSKFTTE